MSDMRKYWIWLATALGYGTRNEEILCGFKNPKEIYDATENERSIAGVFSKQQKEKLNKVKLEDSDRIIEICDKNGWKIITPDHKDYPAGLKLITKMPLVLYVDGDIGCLKGKVNIGVVGTRNPCNESVAIARELSSDMAAAGAVVVSGGALGIDTASHEGALAAGGKTVCVLGCGLGTRYLMENAPLRRQIAENGAVISEFPPFMGASVYSFPIRNRIISGMCHGLLVVEAGEKSGSLITAERAKEQRRQVFAIPGNVLSSAYTGANRLIRDGATAVSDALDILRPFSESYADRLNLEAVCKIPLSERIKSPTDDGKLIKKPAPAGLSENAAAVYEIFDKYSLHPDDISVATNLPVSKVIPALMELEMAGLIVSSEGKNYILEK